MEKYILSTEAQLDLEEIFEYSVQEFNLEQAIKYLQELENTFNLLISNPNIGIYRKELFWNLRSIVKNQHVIYYIIGNSNIRIIRVLHHSQDELLQFKK